MLWLDVDEEELLNKSSETDGVIIGGGSNYANIMRLDEVKLKILPDKGFDKDGALVRSNTEGFSAFASNCAKNSSSARSNSVR